jgi:hypothetical protein
VHGESRKQGEFSDIEEGIATDRALACPVLRLAGSFDDCLIWWVRARSAAQPPFTNHRTL